MFGKKEEKSFDKAETIIGPSVLIKGDLESKGNVLIQGNLEGKIISKGHLKADKGSQITADIEAASADVAGTTKGNLKVKGSLIIRAKAKINGDVECGAISIEEGGILKGKCDMVEQEEQKDNTIPEAQTEENS